MDWGSSRAGCCQRRRVHPAGLTRVPLLSVLPLAILLVACGGGWSVDSARRAIELSGMGVQGADDLVGGMYERKLDELESRIEDETITRSEFDEAIEPYEAAKTAVVALRGGRRTEGERGLLDAAERAVDTWMITGEDDSWLRVVPCLVMALDALRQSLAEIGVQVHEIDYAVSFAKNWADGACHSLTGESSSERHEMTIERTNP